MNDFVDILVEKKNEYYNDSGVSPEEVEVAAVVYKEIKESITDSIETVDVDEDEIEDGLLIHGIEVTKNEDMEVFNFK